MGEVKFLDQTSLSVKHSDGDGGNDSYVESIKIREVSNGWLIEYVLHDHSGEVVEDVEVYNDEKEAVQAIIQLMGLYNRIKLK